MTGALTALLLGVLATSVATAAPTVRLTTPYPAVSLEPGGTTTFDLDLTAPAGQHVDLAVTRKPDGWSATLRGGGFVIDGVTADPKDPPSVQLEVQVPADVEPGTYQVAVRASSPRGSDTLALDLRVAESVPGSVTLTSEFPFLRGAADATFTFDVELANNTARETTFSLEAAGPSGWQVDATPAGEQQAATTTVAPGSTQSVTLTADPPDDEVAGSYQIGIRAAGGGQTAELVLDVEITGNFLLTLTTPDQRLNAEAETGQATQVTLLVVNDGTAPLAEVTLSASPPADWEVAFAPEAIPVVQPGQQARVVATLTPAGDAVAGDYIVTFTASSAEANESIDVRTTVKTSSAWGAVGIALIVAAVAGLGWVFRRFGRR